MQMYRIHRFSKLTGLTTHVIRAWERRYGLVNPVRGANRYRLYNDEDVRLFRYLKSKGDEGMSIGELAEIGREKLLEQAQQEFVAAPLEPPPSERLIADLTQALQENDRVGFERKLNGALAVIPFEEALHRFLLPLQEHIGQLWHDGKFGIAEEHYASNQIKQKIFSAMNQLRMVEEGPLVVVACPSQEWHEISAMTAAYLCAARGCRVHYLGANLPIPELAKFCEQIRPSYALLSMTVDRSIDEIKNIIRELVTQVCPVVRVGVGGYCAQNHADLFLDEKITIFPDLKALDAFVFSLTH
jgi:DNA-binding transcriptional MerR regulator/methylmalonyl-CoA mutase cobalamin-binding subunit